MESNKQLAISEGSQAQPPIHSLKKLTQEEAMADISEESQSPPPQSQKRLMQEEANAENQKMRAEFQEKKRKLIEVRITVEMTVCFIQSNDVYFSFFQKSSLDESLGLIKPPKTGDFYLPRLYCPRTIYLNKSNGKWLLIGVKPGDEFSTAVYLCGTNNNQIRIPGEMSSFIEKIGTLYGVGVGSSTTALIESDDPAADNVTVAKADFGDGLTYKFSGSSDVHRAVYIAASSLKLLLSLGEPIKTIYANVRQSEERIQRAFERVVDINVVIALDKDTTDYKVLEHEMFFSPKVPDADYVIYSEALCSFRNYFYRRVREALTTYY